MIKQQTTGGSANRLIDTTGASVVIALGFFLICAVVGSTVLTAASINAQAAATYRTARQAEYTVGSAAALVGAELQSGVRVSWDWSVVSATTAPALRASSFTGSEFAKALWQEVAAQLWHYRGEEAGVFLWQAGSVTVSNVEIGGVAGVDTVYASITVDGDFGITARLSLEGAAGTAALYDETVYLQAVPEYANNRLVALTWESPVITKTGSG